ncbi:RNA-directed DNA polymerase, eukaryota, reverse transcriptase zinc-binding domain protein, partial [Tanacetum coccineum]
KEAMFGIGDDKAPGPDGFTSKFFKKSWKTTGKDVCEAVREFFKTNKLLGEVNATLITLVPKIHNPNKVSDYRPIACCNVIYKCISKIITNRITGCLDKLISINQSAFVPGRIIQDNLLITQELLKGYNKKSGPARCALKIDIAKAYDTVDWKFLNDIMLNFGFHEKFVGWVMTCVSSAAFTICINGERYGYFKSGRGLRQGDPMSPYLFTLVMEVLTLMVNRRIERENHFKYHWGCKDIKLAQLCFADDLLMLCNGDHQSVKTLKDGLMEFSKSSGLIPNMNKSTIFFGSIKEDEKKRILDVMPFKVGQLPMKYLGVPLITKNIGVSECNQLVDRVKQKVNDWKNKNLSYAGRLQLIAAVLASMHVYWASVFLLPKTTVKDIDKVLKGFLWSQGELKKGAARVAWKIICDPKSKGGLGIKKLGPWNEALLCKHLWNIIIKKESLWVKWVNVVKLKGKSIWEVQCENNDSGTWKAILNLREKIRENVWNKIGDGKSTNMWFDRWCVEGPLCDVIPFRKRYEARLDEKTKVRDMVENNEWVWPISWKTTFCNITRIKVPTLVEGSKDYAFWKDTKGNEVQASIRIIWENFKEEKEDKTSYSGQTYGLEQEFDFNSKMQLSVGVNEDRLSSLPDEIIHQILSRFDTKFVVQTCVLSSRWKLIWKSIPRLDLLSRQFKDLPKFAKFVTRVLSHRNRQVEVSTVKLYFHEAANHREFPPCLFNSPTLKHFALTLPPDSRCVTPKTPWDFPALTTLHLFDTILCNDVIPFRKRYEARLDEKTKVRDMVENNEWVWPISWKTTFCNITRIKVPTLVEGSKDYAFWKDTKGNEVQASIRIIWENFKEEKEDVKWHKAVWFSQGNLRHAFILWLVRHRRLPTQDRLMAWNKNLQLICPLCNKGKDSHDHLFFSCDYSKEVWKKIKGKLREVN